MVRKGQQKHQQETCTPTLLIPGSLSIAAAAQIPSSPPVPASNVSPDGGLSRPTNKYATPQRIPFKVLRPRVLEQAFLDQINGVKPNETSIYVYSRRSHLGYVHTSHRISANSYLLLAASPLFELQSESNVISAKASLKDTDSQFKFTPKNQIDIASYDYESDSDLEEDDASLILAPAIENMSPSMGRDAANVRLPHNDSDFEVMSEASEDITDNPESPAEESTVSKVPPDRENSRYITVGGITQVDDSAYKTWEAFVLYLCNEQITFSPLKSQGLAYAPLRSSCSPKSMYRLAVKLDFEPLQKLAINDLKAKLSAENIVTELFSDFTWRYLPILQMEVEIFDRHAEHPVVKAAMSQIFVRAAKGQLRNSSQVLDLLFSKLISSRGER